jgi:hypothetical protein
MTALKTLSPKGLEAWAERRVQAIWSNLFTNHLWQRMLKNTLATTITIILALIPAVVDVYGRAAYLGPIVTVFGHPGRRFGMMAEALVLVVTGTLVGIGWSMFGIYLSSLVYDTNAPAAYTIKGTFLAIALMFHGFLRSHTPRLWIFVLLLIIISVVGLTGTSTAVSSSLATVLLYPILTAVAVLLLVNTLVFPEFSSSFLGVTTTETLGETVAALRDAGKYFVHVVQPNEELTAECEANGNKEPEDGCAVIPEKKPKNAISSFFSKLVGRSEKIEEKQASPKDIKASPKKVQLKSLTDAKSKLRAKLASCKAAQTECNFELAWAVLPPGDLKPISDTYMKKLVANTIALIGACESKYALMGDDTDKKTPESQHEHQLQESANAAGLEIVTESRPQTAENSQDESIDEITKTSQKKRRTKRKKSLEKEIADLELVKPTKEIASGDVELLKFLVSRISKPLADIQEKIDESVTVVTSCLAYCYDVPKLPSGARAPAGISLEEIDIRVDFLRTALATFDIDSAQALESAAALHDLDHPQVDIMPRMETFLISSFLLNLRQAALHTLEMLNHSRIIVEKRQARHDRSRLYAPKINWRKWLISGGEEDSLALPESGRKDIRTGQRREDGPDEDGSSITSSETLLNKKDMESGPVLKKPPTFSRPSQGAFKVSYSISSKTEKATLIHRLRNGLADIIEYLAGSEDFLYALKLTIAVFLVSWPAFLHKWNAWFSLNRGLWAALQLVLITEVAIGTSVVTFTLRAFGTTIGCLWGWAAYEAGHGNRIVCVVMLVIGIIPSTYIQLGSKYIKAGMVSIVSMCIVALAIEDQTTPGTPTDTFLKRFIAFLIGGIVALVVEVVLFPVKARDRLVESLASSVLQISEMEACLAYGIETETNVDVHSAEVQARFDRAKSKAQGALTAAETFLPFCVNEPRLKGSFRGLALVYTEILYVLHAVVDRMDNMLHLRYEYGSGVLEELNEKVYPYRRNVAASITIVLFAVHEALTTKLPLPQFLPSARLAHLRMVNRVREVVASGDIHKNNQSERSEIEMNMVKRVVRQKFLSWNAASAGQIEVIEYLEELIDLVKLLVGANEFRSGLLTRPTYREYADNTDPGIDLGDANGTHNIDHQSKDDPRTGEQDELRDIMPEPEKKVALSRRRATLSGNPDGLEKIQKKLSEDEEFEKKRQAMQEELPRSLQRVRSRRIEELHLQKTRSREEDAKGKKRVD